MNDEQFFKFSYELDIIVKRTKWMRWSVGLFIFAGLCVAISIASVFISVELRLNLTHFVLITFIAAMLSLTIGLLCFLREIILASKELITSSRQMP
jgi:heme A synthase